MRDGWRLKYVGLGVCPPPAGILVCLGPWGYDAFQKAAYRGIRSLLFFVDEAAYSNTGFHFMALS